jgi:hypothetical protein
VRPRAHNNLTPHQETDLARLRAKPGEEAPFDKIFFIVSLLLNLLFGHLFCLCLTYQIA